MRRVATALACLLAGAPAVAQAQPPSPLWDDVARPNRLRCAQLVDEARKKRTERDVRRSLEPLGEAARLCPTSLEVFVLLGQLRVELGLHEEARAALERARVIEDARPCERACPPRDPHLAFELGFVRALAGDLQGSLIEYHRSVDAGGLGTDQWLLAYDLGDTLMALGRLSEAVDAYRRAVKAAPHEAIARFALAVALDRESDREAALVELDAALAIDPRLWCLTSGRYLFVPPSDQHYYLALCALRRGRLEDARRELEAFLGDGPDGPYAARARAHLEALR